MTASNETKDKLKSLRDRLALEAPRAKTRTNLAPGIAQRLEAALERVNGAYLMLVSKSPPTEALDELIEDVVVEAHLALHEIERTAAAPAAKPRPGGIERRVHERHDTDVKVQLLRHNVKNDGTPGVALESETTKRPARNVSLGGIFVTIPRDELSQIGVGSVVHVSVALGEQAPFKARAVVMRRDPSGIGLSWIQDSDRLRKDVEVLLRSIRKPG